jgi:hypothetical protein
MLPWKAGIAESVLAMIKNRLRKLTRLKKIRRLQARQATGMFHDEYAHLPKTQPKRT